MLERLLKTSFRTWIFLLPFLVSCGSDPSHTDDRTASRTPAATPLQASGAVLPQEGVEFNGPYSSWLNVRNFGAVGDGVHDDTEAIEDAFTALDLGLSPPAVYFPAGTYRITRTLQFPPDSFARGVLGKLVIGEDPATTRLLWDGPEGGDMLWLAGQAHMRYGRLTFDGNGKAAIAIRVERAAKFNLYSSYVQIHDCTFRSSDYGIYNTNRTGTHSMDDTYSILRCAFDGITKAGVRVDAGNAYCWNIRHCRFQDCRIGVQNSYGDFYVMQSRFERSLDVDIEARSHRSGGIRDNLSIGSQQFLRMNGGRYVVQANRVLDLTGDTAIEFNPDFSFTGLLAFDNTIHAEHPIQAIHTSGDSKFLAPVAIIDNIVASDARFDVAQEAALLAGNEQVPDDKIDRFIPPLPGVPPKVERPVISLAAGDNDLQAKIDEAVKIARATPGQRPVVHIAPGEHTLQSTVVVPPNLPIKIVGDGTCSRLVWSGPRSSVQPALLLQGPSRVTIQDVAFRHHLKQGDTFRSPIADILVDNADQPGARIVSDNSWLSGVFADRLQHTAIDLLDHYSANYGGWLFTTLKAVGPATPGPARIGMFGGVAIGDQIHAHVADGGRVLIRDFWHEENSVMKHPWILAEGRGAQPGMLAMQSAFIFQHGRKPIMHLRGFDGTFALVANSFGGNSDRIEVVQPTDSTIFTSLLGWARLEPDTSSPGSQFIYDRRTKPEEGDADVLRGTLEWLRETGPDAVLTPRPSGVTDVRLHRITALYQNGWGVWARPDEHDMAKPGVSVVASVWDAYEHNEEPGVFTFKRDTTDQELTVHYRLEGPGVESIRVNPAGNAVTFPEGVAEVQLQIIPIDNGVPETAREVGIRILPGENYSIGIPRQSERDRIVIHDDDMLQQVWLSRDAVTINENEKAPEGRRVDIELRRDHPYGDLAVKFTLEGEFDERDFSQAPETTVLISDGELAAPITFEAADDAWHEPLESGRLAITPDAAYLRHPDRVNNTQIEIRDNDPIQIKLTAADPGGFKLMRNGNHGNVHIPLMLKSGDKTVEQTVFLPNGKNQVEVALPATLARRTEPVQITVQPFPGSELARLPVPAGVSRRWWAVTPTHVVAIDLEKSAWTPTKDKPGTPAIATSLDAPKDWIPPDTPPMGVTTAYDPIDDRLWVLLAFSRNNAPGPEQTLWRIERVSHKDAAFHKHATFGQVDRGVAFDIQLDAQRDVLLTYGVGTNGRVAAHVKKDGGHSAQKGADVMAFSAAPGGGVWAVLSPRFGRAGVRYWPAAASFPDADGVSALSQNIGSVGAVAAVPALNQMVMDMPEIAVFGHRFAVTELVMPTGSANREFGKLEEDHPCGTTGMYWDPLGRLWIRPQSNQIPGVIVDPTEDQQSPRPVRGFTYNAVVSFDDKHAYMQQFNGTLQRVRFDNPAIDHVKLEYNGEPLLVQSDGDPTGYHWFRTTASPSITEIQLPSPAAGTRLKGDNSMEPNRPDILHNVRRILFYGDSLTDGSSYPDYVVNTLNGLYPEANFELLNAAGAGDTAANLRQRLAKDVLVHKPGLTIICIGTNDSVAGRRKQDFQADLETIVAELKAAGSQVMLVRPSPFADDAREAGFRDILDIIEAVGRANALPVADAHNLFLAWMKDGREPLGADGIHHGRDGFECMAHSVLEAMDLKDVPLVTTIRPWPGLLTAWETSDPVPAGTPLEPERASGWKPYDATARAARQSWWNSPFPRRGAWMPFDDLNQKEYAYGRTWFEAPEAGEYELQIGGSPNPQTLWINGLKVWQGQRTNGYHPNADRVTVKLKQGRNEIVGTSNFMLFVGVAPGEKKK